jgi:hypothetical protein
VEIEPRVQQESSLRADFAVTIGNSRYFYDIQIVVISKDSAREDPYSILKEAADEKRRKYQSLGTFFHPLIFSAGGLMERETSQTYKQLQGLLGPFAASQLDSAITLVLTNTRATSAASIARDLPRKTIHKKVNYIPFFPPFISPIFLIFSYLFLLFLFIFPYFLFSSSILS